MSMLDKKIGDFYEAGLFGNNLKESAELLNTQESNLKQFLYNINCIDYKDETKREARLERARAYFNGQNERRKRKLLELENIEKS